MKVIKLNPLPRRKICTTTKVYHMDKFRYVRKRMKMPETLVVEYSKLPSFLEAIRIIWR